MARLSKDPDYISVQAIESATDTMYRSIDNSIGRPTMSEEDVKVALLMAHRALDYQTALNKDLLERIMDLEEKRKLFRFRKK